MEISMTILHELCHVTLRDLPYLNHRFSLDEASSSNVAKADCNIRPTHTKKYIQIWLSSSKNPFSQAENESFGQKQLDNETAKIRVANTPKS